MIPTRYLFKDLYNDRWGAPANPAQGNSRPERQAIFSDTLLRHRAQRPNAWSFTIPIDRRFR
ncbi:hypothetical protein [Rhizobium herbae]|uniref:Uncharacterized protein n=1 Tax=Rhizobium herbae TaxID=508661 RepID=A0ABS4EKJ2_9HYPH|nr:hypothetical protein [Rhizobium herbae]MBP1858472.1 hypothetical protein [Rhizobium herbae]